MGAYYFIRYRDPTGRYVDRGATQTHFMYMDYTRSLGGDVEKGQVIIPWEYMSCDPPYDEFWVGDPSTPDVYGPDTIIEVWRGSSDINGRCTPVQIESQYLTRNYRRELLNDGRLRTTMIFRGLKDLVNRPIIHPPGPLPLVITDDPVSLTNAIAAWPVPGATAEQYTGALSPADTKLQMETLFQYCAVNTPRPLSNFNPVVPAAGGGITDHAMVWRYDRLLDALNELSAASWYAWYHGSVPWTVGPVDWDIELDATQPFYPWTFTTYPGGRGVDRRLGNTAGNPPLIIAVNRDGAIQPVIKQDRTSEMTRIIVGGRGDKDARDIIAVESDNQNHSNWNTIEMFMNSNKSLDATASPAAAITQMALAGQAELVANGWKDEITLVLKDSPGLRYRLDYDLGDMLTLQWPGRVYGNTLPQLNRGHTVDVQITAIKVQVFNHNVNAPGSNSPSFNEQIEVTFSSLDGSRHRQDAQGSLQKVIDAIRDRAEEIDGDAKSADAYR